MKKFLRKSILDELYQAKNEEFADELQKEIKEEKALLVEAQLTTLIKENIKDEQLRIEIFDKLNKFELELTKEQDFWNNKFFKLGFYDYVEVKRTLNEKFKDVKNTDEIVTFIDESTSDFIYYLEMFKADSLNTDTEYKKLADRIEKIKEDNPNVRTFLEDNEAVPLTDVEENEVLNIIELDDDMQVIELKEAFKLGIQETIKFIIQMNLL